MKLICPECKNETDLSRYPNLAAEQIIECNHCGVTLIITAITDEEIRADVIDEGK